MAKLTYDEIRINKPEREEDIKISAKDLWL